MKPVVRSPLAEGYQVSVFNYGTKETALPPSCSAGVQLPQEEAFLLQAPEYLPQANAGCPESALAMTLSHRLQKGGQERDLLERVWEAGLAGVANTHGYELQLQL